MSVNFETFIERIYREKEAKLKSENEKLISVMMKVCVNLMDISKNVVESHLPRRIGRSLPKPGLFGGNPQKDISVHFHTSNNNYEAWTFTVDANSTILDIKKHIFRLKKIPDEIIILKYMGSLLDDQQQLSAMPGRGTIQFLMEVESAAKCNENILAICQKVDALYRGRIAVLETENAKYKLAMREAAAKAQESAAKAQESADTLRNALN